MDSTVTQTLNVADDLHRLVGEISPSGDEMDSVVAKTAQLPGLRAHLNVIATAINYYDAQIATAPPPERARLFAERANYYRARHRTRQEVHDVCNALETARARKRRAAERARARLAPRVTVYPALVAPRLSRNSRSSRRGIRVARAAAKATSDPDGDGEPPGQARLACFRGAPVSQQRPQTPAPPHVGAAP